MVVYHVSLGMINNSLSSIKEIEQSVPKTTRSRKSSSETMISGADEIRKYRQLADEGIITEEEFEKKKKDILEL